MTPYNQARQISDTLALSSHHLICGNSGDAVSTLETASSQIADLCESLFPDPAAHQIEGFDITTTATELLALSEKTDVLSEQNISAQAKSQWAANTLFLRGLADILDNLPEGQPLTKATLQQAAEKAVA